MYTMSCLTSFARNSTEITLQMLTDLELFQKVLVSVNAFIENKTIRCGRYSEVDPLGRRL